MELILFGTIGNDEKDSSLMLGTRQAGWVYIIVEGLYLVVGLGQGHPSTVSELPSGTQGSFRVLNLMPRVCRTLIFGYPTHIHGHTVV